ncbi:hypothetical protein QM637_02925 [Pantoea allii]|uniref:hypothetical protein n=1 Tax=Pantoea allii TaxID=574096 RepID=UPI0024B7F344|nr:hypothetical protein [Pantoea allii]MDJ0034796.1 hypothetical protein [Pantoea allii]
MRNTIKMNEIFHPQIPKTALNKNSEYYKEFVSAIKFSKKTNLTIDNDKHKEEISQSEIIKLKSELTKSLSGYIDSFSQKHPNETLEKFSLDCVNLSVSILNFINENYPTIPANITIGEISYLNKKRFITKREDFSKNPLLHQNEKFKHHAWITLGKNYILDAAIGTAINCIFSQELSNIRNHRLYGGLVHGIEGSFLSEAIDKSHWLPRDLESLKYQPVIVGLEAIHKYAPKNLQ